MALNSSRLPSRFPVGTKFVIEGRRASKGRVQVYSRYLEFPDGSLFQLPAKPQQLPRERATRKRRASRTARH